MAVQWIRKQGFAAFVADGPSWYSYFKSQKTALALYAPQIHATVVNLA
jgi:hypothetical protein